MKTDDGPLQLKGQAAGTKCRTQVSNAGGETYKSVNFSKDKNKQTYVKVIEDGDIRISQAVSARWFLLLLFCFPHLCLA